MGKKYTQLSLEERCTISILKREGKTLREIASTLDRSASTISREIRRNTSKTKGYESRYAQLQAAERCWRGSKLERQATLRSTVLDLLVWDGRHSKSRAGWREKEDAR